MQTYTTCRRFRLRRPSRSSSSPSPSLSVIHKMRGFQSGKVTPMTSPYFVFLLLILTSLLLFLSIPFHYMQTHMSCQTCPWQKPPALQPSKRFRGGCSGWSFRSPTSRTPRSRAGYQGHPSPISWPWPRTRCALPLRWCAGLFYSNPSLHPSGWHCLHP